MPASIKVEHFEFDIGADGSTKALTTDVGDLTKAFVRNNTPRGMSAGPPSTNASQWVQVISAGVDLSATDQLTGHREGANSEPVRVRGEVWRYEGPPGGPNEIKVRAAGTTGVVTPQAITIDLSSAGIVNPDRCVPFIVGALSPTYQVYYIHRVTAGAWLDANGDLVIERGDTGNVVEFRYVVVEFTGSNWEVGHGEAATVAEGTNTITLKQGREFDGADFDTGSWANAAIISAMQKGPDNKDAVEDTTFTAYPGAGTTQVAAEFAPGAELVGSRVIVHVVKHPNMVVTRGSGSGVIGEGEDNYTISPALTALDEAALEWSSFGDSGGRGHAGGALTAHLTSLTNVSSWVHRTAGPVSYRWGAIDLSGITDAGGGPEPRPSRLALLGVS